MQEVAAGPGRGGRRHPGQHTDPRLGHLGLSLLRAGHAAPRVLEEMAASDQFVERHQLGCLDASERSAARTGSGNRPWAGHHAAPNVVVAANAVIGAGVADAMLAAFQREPTLDLWARLLRALEAGKAAGGQPNGGMSSGLYVAICVWDLHGTPVAELRRLASAYFPLIEYYNLRPIDPSVPHRGGVAGRPAVVTGRPPRTQAGGPDGLCSGRLRRTARRPGRG